MHLWSYDFQQISVFVGVSCMRCAHSALAFFFSWRVVLNENMLGVYFKRIWIRCFFWLVERERNEILFRSRFNANFLQFHWLSFPISSRTSLLMCLLFLWCFFSRFFHMNVSKGIINYEF